MEKEVKLYGLYHPLSRNYIWTSDEIGPDFGGDTPELRELDFWTYMVDDTTLELESMTISTEALEIHEFNCKLSVILDTDIYLKMARENRKNTPPVYPNDRIFHQMITVQKNMNPDPLDVDLSDIADYPREGPLNL